MNIALTASTGKVGTALLAAARSHDVVIRALARDPSRIATGPAVAFDFADRTTYARALEGIRTLVLVSPPIPGQDASDCAFVDAARAAGVTHVVKVSGAGAERWGTRFSAQHRVVEEHLRASWLGWTFVRPTFFMENMLGIAGAIAAGTYPAPTADAAMTQVAVEDIAAVLLAVAVAPEQHREAAYMLTGPSADRGDAIARVLEAAAGHPVRYADVPEEAFRENLLRAGLDAWSAGGIVEAFEKVRAGEATEISEDIRRVTGRAPTDFATWATRHAAAFRAGRG